MNPSRLFSDARREEEGNRLRPCDHERQRERGVGLQSLIRQRLSRLLCSNLEIAKEKIVKIVQA